MDVNLNRNLVSAEAQPFVWRHPEHSRFSGAAKDLRSTATERQANHYPVG
jgi:hypothetical protein